MASPEPILTGHRDGFCIWLNGREVAVFPSFLRAANGLRAAREAMSQLSDLLGETSPTEGASDV